MVFSYTLGKSDANQEVLINFIEIEKNKDNVMKKIPKKMQVEAENLLGKYQKNWWLREISQSYPWLKNVNIYWVIDEDTGESAIISHTITTDKWKALNHPKGIQEISELIRKQLDGILWKNKLSILDFSTLLMEWYKTPQGYICSDTFLQEQEDVIESFLNGVDKNITSLVNSCMTPIYKENKKGEWSILFNALNKDGGIDRWNVLGVIINFDIKKIEITEVKPIGSFYYPDEL